MTGKGCQGPARCAPSLTTRRHSRLLPGTRTINTQSEMLPPTATVALRPPACGSGRGPPSPACRRRGTAQPRQRPSRRTRWGGCRRPLPPPPRALLRPRRDRAGASCATRARRGRTGRKGAGAEELAARSRGRSGGSVGACGRTSRESGQRTRRVVGEEGRARGALCTGMPARGKVTGRAGRSSGRGRSAGDREARRCGSTALDAVLRAGKGGGARASSRGAAGRRPGRRGRPVCGGRERQEHLIRLRRSRLA